MKRPLKERYRDLRIRYLMLYSRYLKLKARMMKGLAPKEGYVSEKEYLELKGKLKRAQATIEKLRLQVHRMQLAEKFKEQ